MRLIGDKKVSELREELSKVLDPHRKALLDVSGVKIALFKIIQGYIAKVYEINPEGIYLYRARINEDCTVPVDYFFHTDQLGAPPRVKASKGRCNDAGESILYCSDHPITCLAELHNMKVDDYVTIIIYEVKKDRKIKPVSFVGVDILRENDNLLTGLIEDFYKDLKSHNHFDRIKTVDDLISDEFRLSVNSNKNHHIYNTTIAWRQMCFEYSQANCLIYPSASSLLKTANYVFAPDFANDTLIPIEAHRFRIKEINNDGLDFVTVRDAEAHFLGYGKMEWKNIEPHTEYLTHRRLDKNPFKMDDDSYKSKN